MVIARIEALIAGWGQEEALKRAHAYVGGGADAILIHSKSNVTDEIVGFANAWNKRAPLVIVPTSYPVLTSEELEKLGIKMVIYANQGLRASIRAISEVLAEIRRTGRLDTINNQIVPMSEVFDLHTAAALVFAEHPAHRIGAALVRLHVAAVRKHGGQ